MCGGGPLPLDTKPDAPLGECPEGASRNSVPTWGVGGGAGLFVFNDTIEGPRSPAVKPSQGVSLKPDESGSMVGQAGLRADADCR